MGLRVLRFARIGQSPKSSSHFITVGSGGGYARGGVRVHRDAETGVQSDVVCWRFASGIGAEKGNQKEFVW